jgi:hypothetical protein
MSLDVTKQPLDVPVRPHQASVVRPRVPQFGFIIGAVVLLLLSIWLLVPWVTGLRAASIGSQALEAADAGHDRAVNIRIAVERLELAVATLPFDPRLQQLLAHAYLLDGRSDDAVASLEAAYRFRPDSLLIKRDLANAYLQNGQYEASGALRGVLVLSPERMISYGDQAFSRGQPAEALEHYLDVIARIGVVSPSFAFRVGAAAMAAGDPQASYWLAQADFDLDLHTTRVNRAPQRIEAEELHYLFDASVEHDGIPLARNPTDDPTIGAMWWSGIAVAPVYAEIAGRYTLTLRAQHSDPAVDFALVVNGATVAVLPYATGDGSWEQHSVDVELRRGFNLVGVRLLDGTFAPEGDRNGFVDWLGLEPQP